MKTFQPKYYYAAAGWSLAGAVFNALIHALYPTVLCFVGTVLCWEVAETISNRKE